MNCAPIGPNAAIVSVDVVLKTDAFLWRPSADMVMMGDALNGNIVWPLEKIQFINLSPREESPKRSSPMVSFYTFCIICISSIVVLADGAYDS